MMKPQTEVSSPVTFAPEEFRNMVVAITEICSSTKALEFAINEHYSNVVRLVLDFKRSGSGAERFFALEEHTEKLLGGAEQISEAVRAFQSALKRTGPTSENGKESI